MKHVFVETNWVFEFAVPAHLRSSTALTLAQKAAAGDLRLYVPSVCLTEASAAIRRKINPASAANSVRKYLAWASTVGELDAEDSKTVRRVLDKFEISVQGESDRVEERLALLRSHPGIEVFSLSEEMLVRAVELSLQNLYLEPFDQAILAAVLVRAQALRNLGAEDICFCELDHHLRPWEKETRQTKQPLTALYDAAGVWVYGDFVMGTPPKRPGFPEQ
jgi:predicted nucleic acid-binding protein